MRLLVLGPGYSASAVIDRLRSETEAVAATARSEETTSALRAAGIRPIPFDGVRSKELAGAIAEATHILVSIPPGPDGDPVLAAHRSDLAAASHLAAIAYLSTVGVYGDHGGAWVDEETMPEPVSQRSIARIAAEDAWRETAAAAGVPIATLRLAGIYGPGRNALRNLAAGTARRIAKPGQVFNRIHVDDIATATATALRNGADALINVTDDLPAPPQDVVAFAAELMGIEAPPEIPFGEADLTPMARSFYGENKRVSNARLRETLGISLQHPTYREGLTALWRGGEGRSTG